METNPSPTARWGSSKPPSQAGLRPPDPKPPTKVGRVAARPDAPRSRAPLILASCVGALVLVATGVWLASSLGLDRPPSAAVEIELKHVLRWDLERTSEVVEGLLFLDGDVPAVLSHFTSPTAPEVVVHVYGKQGAPLRELLRKASADPAPAARLKYLDLLYPRFEHALRFDYGIDRREDLPAQAAKVKIRFPSSLFVRLDMRIPALECADPEHQGTVRPPCAAKRYGWLDRILAVQDLQ